MSSQDVISLMESSKTESEWNKNCDYVKKQFDGQYPEFWFKDILASGLAARTQAKFT